MINFFAEKLENLEEFVVDIIYDRRKTKLHKFCASILKVLSYVFTFVVQLRLLLFKNRIFKSRSLGCLVVTVGNLTVGGTGKTPIVEKFARRLTERGRKVAILSRGYKSKPDPLYRRFWRWMVHLEPAPPKIVSDGNQVLLDSELAGDEPFMLARNLPGVAVLVDKDRVKAGLYAIQKLGVDTLILDDGFQYLHLKGRLNLLLIDKTNPFGNGHLLPRGILREPIKHLKRASYVFLTKSDGQHDPALEQMIHHYHPGVEIIECAHGPQYLQALDTNEQIPLESLRGKRVAALSGIAMPEGFEDFLRKSNADLVYIKRFIDHHRFTHDEIHDFYMDAQEHGAEIVVTTEKDAVRFPETIPSSLPSYFLRLEIDILKGDSDFEKAVSELCFPKNKMRATRPMVGV